MQFLWSECSFEGARFKRDFGEIADKAGQGAHLYL